MQWRSDRGLQARMVFTMVLLAGLYVAFLWYLVELAGLGVTVALLIVGSLSLVQLFFSHKITLRAVGARKVDPQEYPQLHDSVERLARQADLPKPTVAVADSRNPNAFATGPTQKKGVVCVTTGLLETLDRRELEGVLAHELAHIKNRDMVVMTVASLLSTVAFAMVRWGFLFGGRGRRGGGGGVFVAIFVSLIVWIVSYLLIRALSRYREYAADRGGAAITGDPAALASALLTISGEMDEVPKEDLRGQSEMNAFYIIPIRRGFVGRLFSTHPSTERRVERLRELTAEMERA